MNLYNMRIIGTRQTAKLSPLVSIKSWRVMDVGSMWCSRNGRMNACQHVHFNDRNTHAILATLIHTHTHRRHGYMQ